MSNRHKKNQKFTLTVPLTHAVEKNIYTAIGILTAVYVKVLLQLHDFETKYESKKRMIY